MSRNKWVRSISFNKRNPDDVQRLEFIGDQSFSKVVKRLIDLEMKRQDNIAAPKRPSIYDIREEKLRRH